MYTSNAGSDGITITILKTYTEILQIALTRIIIMSIEWNKSICLIDTSNIISIHVCDRRR